MTSPDNVTKIDANYLTNTLEPELKDVLSHVEEQLKGIGASNDPDLTGWLNPVDDTLSVLAGANGFTPAITLNAALKLMGGSIHDQLVWLQTLLTDMINEIDTTVASFIGTEDLNTETVDQLLNDFQNTINDFSNFPGKSGK